MRTRWALVLVDWDTSRRIAKGRVALRYRNTQSEIAEAITLIEQKIHQSIGGDKNILKVSWRIYHGWHNGLTPTEDRLRFAEFLQNYKSHRINNTYFGRDFAFGDELLCRSERLPLRYTLRTDFFSEKPRQKMVDTALTVDLLQASRTNDFDHLIVVGNDDDLLPGIIVSESWGSNVIYLRVGNERKFPLLPNKDRGFPVINVHYDQEPA